MLQLAGEIKKTKDRKREVKLKSEKATKAILIILIIILLLLLSGMYFCKAYRIKTASMEPAIKTGSVVVILKNDKIATDIKKGDICAYKKGDMTVIHRVYEVDEATGSITFKGDANDAPDPGAVSREDIIGKVILII